MSGIPDPLVGKVDKMRKELRSLIPSEEMRKRAVEIATKHMLECYRIGRSDERSKAQLKMFGG